MIPSTLQDDILNQLHVGHMGIERTRRLARGTVFWPNISKDIEHITKTCAACQELQTKQQKEPLQPHDIPTAPWTKLGTDLFVLNREDYLLVTDYHSKYPLVYKLKDTSSKAVAGIMSGVFSLFGPPAEIMSDNGPQFTGQPFKDMCRKWSITHKTSSPHYPRSNGLAERMVRTVKIPSEEVCYDQSRPTDCNASSPRHTCRLAHEIPSRNPLWATDPHYSTKPSPRAGTVNYRASLAQANRDEGDT